MVDFISFLYQLIDRQRVNTLVNDLNSKNKIEFFKKRGFIISYYWKYFYWYFNNDKKTQEINE